MALNTDVLSLTLNAIVEAETSALYQNTAFLSGASKMGGIQRDAFGNKITVPVDLKEHSVTTDLTSGYEPLSVLANTIHEQASFDWARSASTIMVSGKDLALANSEKAIVKILDARTKSVLRRMGRELNAQIIAGAGTSFASVGSLNGYLEAALPGGGAQSNSVGGLSKATYAAAPGWNNCFADVAGDFSANGLAAMRSLQTQIGLFGGKEADLVILSEAAQNNLRSVLFTGEQYSSARDVDGGRPVFMFGGSKIDIDLEMPTTTISGYFLSFDDLYLAVHPDCDFKVSELVKRPGYDVYEAQVEWMGQLICSNLRKQGVLHDAETY